ncbi:hypothetical protein ACUNV4_00080 [Granulosicoccus sp. 3-233]|uniref:hypothetical protein n=1 Tax=Granulosicoccus sp. 3-233 TaxID=3417969 RepID=UPI003D325C35
MTVKTRPRLYLVPSTNGKTPIRSQMPPCPSHLQALSLECRLLLAILRLSNSDGAKPALSLNALNTLGQVMDCGPHRTRTLAALSTINQTVLVQTHRRLEIPNTVSNDISPDEALYIDSIRRLSKGTCAKNEIPLSAVMSDQNLGRFCQAAEHILGVHSMSRLRHRAILRDASAAEPTVLKSQQLELTESVILALMRLWVRGSLTGFNSSAAVRFASAHLGVERLGNIVSAIMQRVDTSSHSPLDVRCVCSGEITPDEAHMLTLMSALGHGELPAYRDHLLKWLDPQWANAVFIQTSDAVLAIGELGSMLPRRQWDFEELDTRQQQRDTSVW